MEPPFAISDSTDRPLATKADRIHAMRSQLSQLNPEQSRRFLECAAAAAAAQDAALASLAAEINRRGAGEGFYRESRPRAFLAHEAVRRDARLPGVYPFGSEAAAINASAAILFENETLLAGDHVRQTLLGPVVSVLGPESVWTQQLADCSA